MPLFFPDDTSVISVDATTVAQVLDPGDKLEIDVSSTGAAVASLPDPVAVSAKNYETTGVKSPKVVIGQFLIVTHGTDGGGSFALSYKDLGGNAKTATSEDAADSIVLIAGPSGYTVVDNVGFTIA